MLDVIVVGGGHAGIEAALITARLGCETALISLSLENIGKMPCNPSVGGPAKGIVVREIDALGGQMGITADQTALQFKMLNTTKARAYNRCGCSPISSPMPGGCRKKFSVRSGCG